jgi:hypothetical protein
LNTKENILNTIQRDILKITHPNGYINNIQNVLIGTKDIQNINTYPTVTIAEGISKILKNFNAKGDELIEYQILIRCYTDTNDNSNTINSIRIKNDIRKMLYADKNINKIYTSELNTIPEVKKYYIAEETGLLEYNAKIEYSIILLKVEYISYADEIDGSSKNLN